MYLNTTRDTRLDVTLEPVTIDNFEALMEMALPPEQADYLASNAYLIAQSHCYPDWRARASGACSGLIVLWYPTMTSI